MPALRPAPDGFRHVREIAEKPVLEIIRYACITTSTGYQKKSHTCVTDSATNKTNANTQSR
jgi:hypothetical protein